MGRKAQSCNLSHFNSLAEELMREVGAILRTSNEPAEELPLRLLELLKSLAQSQPLKTASVDTGAL